MREAERERSAARRQSQGDAGREQVRLAQVARRAAADAAGRERDRERARLREAARRAAQGEAGRDRERRRGARRRVARDPHRAMAGQYLARLADIDELTDAQLPMALNIGAADSTCTHCLARLFKGELKGKGSPKNETPIK